MRKIMTNKDILRVALNQQAIDCHCRPEDFLRGENTVVISRPDENARRYLNLPFFCDFVSYGSGIVASVDERIADFVKDYLDREVRANGTMYESFLTPRLHLLTEEFAKYGKQLCFMAEYFLPDMDVIKPLPCPYECRILNSSEFADLYRKEWHNALSERRKELDVLAAAAYDKGRLIGLAGCSADCDTMWQIGIDVLPEYRKQGVASALTSRLAAETLERGKVPFYCCAWSNIGSARNAVKSGFRPAWAEMTAIDMEKAAEYRK